MSRWLALILACGLTGQALAQAAPPAAARSPTASTTAALPLQETPYWRHEVESLRLPPVAERLPQAPLVIDLEAKGRSFGTPGGTMHMLISRSKDVRQMVVYGYARLVGYALSLIHI